MEHCHKGILCATVHHFSMQPFSQILIHHIRLLEKREKYRKGWRELGEKDSKREVGEEIRVGRADIWSVNPDCIADL